MLLLLLCLLLSTAGLLRQAFWLPNLPVLCSGFDLRVDLVCVVGSLLLVFVFTLPFLPPYPILILFTTSLILPSSRWNVHGTSSIGAHRLEASRMRVALGEALRRRQARLGALASRLLSGCSLEL